MNAVALPSHPPLPDTLSPCPEARLRQAKWAYTARLLDPARVHGLVAEAVPRAGDLLLARVLKLGQHPRLELASGRKAQLYVDDEVVVVYGNRYAPDQFEAWVPGDLTPCDLVAAGGVAAALGCRHGAMKAPTRLQPMGLLAGADARPLNLRDMALRAAPRAPWPPLLAVVGTAMNAGKTTAAASLVQGLVRQGRRVAAAKLTGTGAGGDRWALLDAGAERVLDFTDLGHVSTYGLDSPRLTRLAGALLDHLAAGQPDYMVVEVADGLYQQETRALLDSPLARRVDGWLFAAQDAMGAVAGVVELERRGLPVLAVSGVVSASPLAVREIHQQLHLPVFDKRELRCGVALLPGTNPAGYPPAG